MSDKNNEKEIEYKWVADCQDCIHWEEDFVESDLDEPNSQYIVCKVGGLRASVKSQNYPIGWKKESCPEYKKKEVQWVWEANCDCIHHKNLTIHFEDNGDGEIIKVMRCEKHVIVKCIKCKHERNNCIYRETYPSRNPAFQGQCPPEYDPGKELKYNHCPEVDLWISARWRWSAKIRVKFDETTEKEIDCAIHVKHQDESCEKCEWGQLFGECVNNDDSFYHKFWNTDIPRSECEDVLRKIDQKIADLRKNDEKISVEKKPELVKCADCQHAKNIFKEEFAAEYLCSCKTDDILNFRLNRSRYCDTFVEKTCENCKNKEHHDKRPTFSCSKDITPPRIDNIGCDSMAAKENGLGRYLWEGYNCDDCIHGPRKSYTNDKIVDSCGIFVMADQCYEHGFGSWRKKDEPIEEELDLTTIEGLRKQYVKLYGKGCGRWGGTDYPPNAYIKELIRQNVNFKDLGEKPCLTCGKDCEHRDDTHVRNDNFSCWVKPEQSPEDKPMIWIDPGNEPGKPLGVVVDTGNNWGSPDGSSSDVILSHAKEDLEEATEYFKKAYSTPSESSILFTDEKKRKPILDVTVDGGSPEDVKEIGGDLGTKLGDDYHVLVHDERIESRILNNDNNKEENEKEETTMKKAFACNNCNNIEYGEKPEYCPQCGKKWNKKKWNIRHRKIHVESKDMLGWGIWLLSLAIGLISLAVLFPDDDLRFVLSMVCGPISGLFGWLFIWASTGIEETETTRIQRFRSWLVERKENRRDAEIEKFKGKIIDEKIKRKFLNDKIKIKDDTIDILLKNKKDLEVKLTKEIDGLKNHIKELITHRDANYIPLENEIEMWDPSIDLHYDIKHRGVYTVRLRFALPEENYNELRDITDIALFKRSAIPKKEK